MPVQALGFADLFTVSGGVGGMVVGAAGLLVPMTAPAVEYDPVTLAVRGLYVPTAVTNIMGFSEQLDSWGGNVAPNDTVATPNVAAAPDGATTADRLVSSATSGSHLRFRATPSVTSGETYTASVFCKADSAYTALVFSLANTGFPAVPNLVVNVATGVITAQNAGAVGFIEPYADGWFRVHLEAVAGATGIGSVRMECRPTTGTGTPFAGDGTSGCLVWGMQFHPGSRTGYIPCYTSASAARTQGQCKIDGTKFAQLWRQTEGSVLVRFEPRYIDPTLPRFTWGAGAVGSDRVGVIQAQATGAVYGYAQTGGVAQAAIGSNVAPVGAVAEFAYSFKNNEFLTSLNGAAVQTDAAGTLSSVAFDRMFFGASSNNSQLLDGWVRDVVYIPKATPAAELPTLGVRVDAWRAGGRRSW